MVYRGRATATGVVLVLLVAASCDGSPSRQRTTPPGGASASTTASAVGPSVADAGSIAVVSLTLPVTSIVPGTVAPTTPSTTQSVPNPATLTLADVVQHGPPSRHRVALTFDSNMTAAMLRKLDDGRVASYANTSVIDQLDTLGVPATFFLAGLWMERYPDVTARLAANPRYKLGTHSYAHKGFTASCYGLGTIAAADMRADVDRAVHVLRKHTDHPVPYFRFPGLCVDQPALDAIAPLGLTVVHGDVPSGDAFGTDPGAIVRQTLRGVHDGSIVILHITGGDTAPRTQDVIGPIVQGLRDAGYELVKVSDLLRD